MISSPFYIGIDDSETGARLGGRSPAGIFPRHVSDLTRYLMTVPVSPDIEASIFTSFDHDSDGPSNPYDVCGILFDDSNPLVETVFHEPSPPNSTVLVPSDIPGHALRLIESGSLTNLDDFVDSHWFGGHPHFRHEHSQDFVKSWNSLLDDGYKQLVQLAFPSHPNDALINTDWPFGEYIFHLFLRPEKGTFRYHYCWG